LEELHQTLTCTKRVPYHVLLGGEDLLKREVLNQQKATEDTVECIWRSSHFRAAIRRKFDEVIIPDQSNIDSRAIEEQLFAKAKTKDEYLDLSARVIIHFKQLKEQCSSVGQMNHGSPPQGEKSSSKRKSVEPASSSKKCKLSDWYIDWLFNSFLKWLALAECISNKRRFFIRHYKASIRTEYKKWLYLHEYH